MRRRVLSSGFTLIELMIVVAIIGVLAAVAIPAFMRYARKSKTVEAVQSVHKMYEASRSYFMDMHQARGATAGQDPTFPGNVPQGLTPALSCCGQPADKCAPLIADWETPTWDALRFAMTDPHYYRYMYISTGQGEGAAFTARAIGDLDCDTRFSTFEMTGVYREAYRDIEGSAGLYRKDDVE